VPGGPPARDLAISIDDFLRLLGSMPQCRDRRVEEGVVRVPLAHGEVWLHYEALPDRPLGPLRLPVTRIGMTFHDVPEPEARAFADAFELYLRRGGG